MSPELLPALEKPLAWVRDYREELKTGTIWCLITSNVMMAAYMVGWKAASRRATRTFGPPASTPPQPPYNDLGVDLIGPRPVRYDEVNLNELGLGGYEDGDYEVPLPMDNPRHRHRECEIAIGCEIGRVGTKLNSWHKE